MITIAHLMDDFGMGGVTRAFTLFEEPMIQQLARSEIVSTRSDARIAPKLEADLIVDHATLSWGRLPFLASLRARNPKARIVHVEHSYTRGFEQREVSAKARFRAMLRIASGLVDDIACVSEAQRNWLQNEVRIARDKLRVIHPWTDRSELFAIAPAKRIAKGPVRLLAYGRYAPVKNFVELISAMRLIDPKVAQLTLFGDGPERSLLEARAKDLPHVDVHGPSEDPGAYLAECDAVIVPSRYEAFGLVATEARMAARAVFVADVDGLPEQVGAGGRVVHMRTAQDIVQAIRWATGADLASLGAAARRGVKNQHAKILKDWIKLIEEIEASAGGAAASTQSDRIEKALA